MFEILRTAASDVTTEAAYRIGLRIWEREYYRDWRKWLPLRPDGRLLPGTVDVVTHVLAEIERRSGKSLADLSDAELKPYQRRINDILDKRWAEEYPDPEGVGERLLNELRRDYGLPEWRAVA
jgi:hypothetical protein